MAHLTINIDDELLRASKVLAAQKGTSVSKLVRDHLAVVTGLQPQNSGDDPLLRFSRGEIGRKDATRMLGVDYSTLIDRLAERDLPLPSSTPDQIEEMVGVMDRVLSGKRAL